MKKLLIPLLLAGLTGTAAASDGAALLREALARFKNQSPLKAQLLLKSESQGDEQAGSAQVQLPIEDGPQGLRLLYPQALLSKATLEDEAKDRDPKASTPTSSGLKQVDLGDLASMTRAAESLQRRLSRASLKSEKAEAWQGQPARKLSFELENSRPSKYVKDYSGLLEVWINEQGVPLASRAQHKMSGRFMVVVSFDMSQEDEAVYQVSGDRLLATRRSSKSQGSGAGEKGSSNKLLTLNLG